MFFEDAFHCVFGNILDIEIKSSDNIVSVSGFNFCSLDRNPYATSVFLQHSATVDSGEHLVMCSLQTDYIFLEFAINPDAGSPKADCPKCQNTVGVLSFGFGFDNETTFVLPFIKNGEGAYFLIMVIRHILPQGVIATFFIVSLLQLLLINAR